ncbi:MAG: diacylglycerol/lipid kinase family protein [Kiritimatiellia bacterium]|jgi:diacylglycerol kinase (ATP)
MKFRKVRVFFNKKAGAGMAFRRVQEAFSVHWKQAADDLAWYFPATPEESFRMLDAAIDDGAECIIVCGGDGTVSSIGTRLIGTDVCMGVVPIGSGNGFARHFAQSLNSTEAVAELSHGAMREMDVGYVNNRPFLVSASAAWDAALVKAYNQAPIRGVGTYVLAGVYSFFDYTPKPVRIVIDEAETLNFDRPILLTIGNLSGWGGGALIDREASACDGCLELVVARKQDAPILLANLADVFNRGLANLPYVTFRQFKSLRIERTEAQPIQLDGELHDAPKILNVNVTKGQLKILVPASPRT